MNILACTGIPELESELNKYCVIQSVPVVDDILALAQSWKPDAVLLSVYLPSFKADIIETCRNLRRNGIRIVVMCGEDIGRAWPFFEAGISDFIVGSKTTVHKVIQIIKYPMSISDAAIMFQKYIEPDETAHNVYEVDKKQRFKEPGDFILTNQNKEEEQEEHKGPPVVGFWGPKPGTGTGSIARAVAVSIASFLKVLLVETDFRYPSAMFSLGMVDEEKCIEKAIQVIQEGSGSVSQCILNRRNCKSKINVPDGFNLLAPSIERGLELFPRIEEEETVAKIHELFKDDFDLMVYDLASELDSYLTVGAMKQCTHLIIVIDGRPAVMSFLEKRLNLLKRLKIKAVENCVVVTNKLPGEIAVQKIQQLCGLKVIHNIPFDREMNEAVMNMLPGGKAFMKSMENLCSLIGLGDSNQSKNITVSNDPVWKQLKGGSGKKWALNQLFSTTR